GLSPRSTSTLPKAHSVLTDTALLLMVSRHPRDLCLAEPRGGTDERGRAGPTRHERAFPRGLRRRAADGATRALADERRRDHPLRRARCRHRAESDRGFARSSAARRLRTRFGGPVAGASVPAAPPRR